MIKKLKGKYAVLSSPTPTRASPKALARRGLRRAREKTGRSFGSYRTLAEAKKRLRQVEFFKHRGLKKKT